MTPDLLAALLANPAQEAEVHAEDVPVLLACLALERERIAALERPLLARLTGERVVSGAPAPRLPLRSRALWLRVAQVAEEYGVKCGTVYDWIYEKRVTTKKLGPSRRAPVLLYRPDVEKLATVRRALRASLAGL